ncbi:MAG: WecB/TagA/CpsF family glycosyltransferase [Clostridia bacterium]|nr:WecB/TagA/CpsF family glycosyltransferase [Clostridia bacterium]
MRKIKDKFKRLLNIKNVTKLFLAFIILQPVFDILSFLNLRGYIPLGISTIIKPLFVFGLGTFIYITNKAQRKKYTLTLLSYGILTVVHNLILKDLLVANQVILHEIRFMVNIAYMIVMFMIVDYLYVNSEDKKTFVKQLKKTLILTFFIYCITIIVAIITGTSAKTYEYSDATKQGFKGWLDSGQIFGHALSITLPFLIYYVLNCNVKNKILNFLCKISIILPVIVLLLIGTKVTYFIALLTLLSHVVLDLIFFFKEKNKKNLVGSLLCLVLLCVSIACYKYLPVKKNMDINSNVLSVDMSGIAKGSETNRKDLEDLKSKISKLEQNGDGKTEDSGSSNKNQERKLKRLQDYFKWDYESSSLLEKRYATGELHPSDMRSKQLIYNLNKYKLSSLRYKIFGLRYLNQPETLSIERDLFMIVFSFGILGSLTVLAKPILMWIRSFAGIIKNIKKINLETLYLFEGFSIFFCISIYAGYTFIYTNFSIFLVIISLLLRNSLEKYKDNKFNAYFEKIYSKGEKAFFKELENKLVKNEKQFIITANPETIMQSEKNEDLRKAVLDKETVVIPDGIGIIKGAEILNYDVKETILGIDVAKKLLELGNQHSKKIFLFGAQKEVIKKMKDTIKKNYPNCEIVGAVDGYVEDKDSVFEEMKEVKPDIVLVALGIPKQEILIYNHLKDFDKGIFVGVGGSFDVISGSKKRAPKIFVKLKLEWLYRITREPKRLKRFYESNIKYLLKIKA